MIKTKERKRKKWDEKKIMKQREPEIQKERKKKKVSREECEGHFEQFILVSFSPQFSLNFEEKIF